MKEDNISQLVIMTRHSVNNNTRMGLVTYHLNSNHLISLIPPKLPQILDIYSVVALYLLTIYTSQQQFYLHQLP